MTRTDDPDARVVGRGVWWCLLAPIVAVGISAVRAVRYGWVPRNDRVFVQLRVLDVFGSNTPLLGMPSTLSGAADSTAHHLGPGQFWLLAVPFRAVSALTNSPASLAIAAAIVTMVALVAVTWCLKSLGCSPNEALMACGFISVAMWQATTQVAISPWNPDFAFIMFAAATTVCVAISARGPTLAATAAVVVLASLAAQAHLSFVLPSVALVVVTFASSLRSSHVERRTWILVIAAVSVGVWSGPILDLIANGGGNIATLVSASDANGVGFTAAFDRFAHSMAPWHHGLQQPRDGETFLLAATWPDRLFGLSMIAAVAATVSMRGRARRLAVTTFVVVVATIVAAAISPENLGTAVAAHVQRVWIVPTLLVWATVVVGLIRVVRPRPTNFTWRPERPLAGVGVVAAVALLMSALWSGYDNGTMDAKCSDAVSGLTSSVIDSARDGDIFDSTAIAMTGLGPAQDIATGLYGELVRQGISVQLVATTDPDMIRDHRFAPPTRPKSFSTITISPEPPTSSAPTLLATATCQTQRNRADVWVSRERFG